MNGSRMSSREATDTVVNAIDGGLYWACRRATHEKPQDAVGLFVDWAVDNASCDAVFWAVRWAVNGTMNEGKPLCLEEFLHDRCGGRYD